MRFPLFLLIVVLSVLVWSALGPHDWPTWWLEVIPTLLGLVALAFTWRRFRFTDLVLTLIALHMILLCVGGHYTYARVPLGEWAREWFHLDRNHYDRLGHFAQGFVPAMIAREIFLRRRVIATRGWMNFLIVCTCLAISAVYELFEALTAVISGSAATEFLATQGDIWDTQKDMAMALIGATCALVCLSRWHDRALTALNAGQGKTACL